MTRAIPTNPETFPPESVRGRYLLTGLSCDPLWQRVASLTRWPDADRLCFVIPNYRYRTFLERELLRLSGKPGVVLPDILTIDQVWVNEVLNPDNRKLESADQRSWLIRKAIRAAGKDLTRTSPAEGWTEPVSKTFRLLDSVSSGGLNRNFEDPVIRDLFGSDSDLMGKLWPVYREFRSMQTSLSLVSREQVSDYFISGRSWSSRYDAVVFCGLDEWIPAHWEYLTQLTSEVPLVIWMDDLSHDLPEQKPDWSIFLPAHQHESFPSQEAIPRELTGFRTAREEVEWMAASIRESGVSLHDCCVVVPDPATYHPWITLIFREAGIPFNLSIGTRVSSTPVGRLVHDWLQVAVGEAGYQEMKAFLLNPIIDRPDQVRWLDGVMELQPEPTHLDEWLSAESFSGIRRDESFWKSVSGHAEDLRRCTQFADWCRQLADWLSSLIRFREATDRHLMPFEGWQAFNLILKTLDQLAAEPGWDLLLDRTDFAPCLRQRLMTVSSRPPVRDGVQILGPMEIQGYRFSHLYLCGLNHHFFPSRASTGTLISFRMLAGADEYFIRQFLKREEVSFQRVLKNPVNQVYLTGSVATGDTQFFPSVYVQKMGIPILPGEKTTPGIRGIRQTLIGAADEENWPVFIRDRRAAARHQAIAGSWMSRDGLLSDAVTFWWRPVLNRLQAGMSATRLDRFGHCGQWFWYEDVLRLKNPEWYDPVMNAAERGKVLHETLRRFLASHQGSPDPYRPDEEVLLELRAHFFESSEKSYQTGQFMHESEKNYILNSPSSPLVHYWQLEKALRTAFPQMRTLYTEQAFGRPSSDSWPALTLGEWVFSGSIDRIDQIGDEEHSTGIVDYKTSSKDKTGDLIAEFRAFQLLIYTLASAGHVPQPRFLTNLLLGGKPADIQTRLQPWLGSLTDFRTITGNPRVGGKLTKMVHQEGLSVFTDRWTEGLTNTLTRLERGEFLMNQTAHHTGVTGCPDYCDFRQVCRRDPDRTALLSSEMTGGDE